MRFFGVLQQTGETSILDFLLGYSSQSPLVSTYGHAQEREMENGTRASPALEREESWSRAASLQW